MSGLDNLKTRLNYYGGSKERRLINDKLRSLKKLCILIKVKPRFLKTDESLNA